MSTVRAPGLGPIVGHTTHTTARIWIRAASVDEHGADVARHRRTIGVVAVSRIDGRRPRTREVRYFRLRREFDRTGTFTLGADSGLSANADPSPPLRPASQYEIRVGTLTIDDSFPDQDSASSEDLGVRLPDPRVWWDELHALDEHEAVAKFATFPDPNTGTGTLTFLVGSCRYPGILWKGKQSDAIFGPMLDHVGSPATGGAAFSLMVGDQIYADMLNRHIPIGLADTFEEFQDRYHKAFGSRRLRRLLQRLPTYMILDDHEIEDNWTQDRIYKDSTKRRVFNLAINAYVSYQWVHGPRSYGERLFYRFNCGGYPFFVLDTRTQRFMDDVAENLADNHLLGRPSLDPDEPSQLDVLLDWMARCDRDVPKFIVSSSVFAPNPLRAREGRTGSRPQQVKWKESSDSWPAFPETRRAILRTIADNGIRNVVFVSGDIHCSNVAEIRIAGPRGDLKAFSITSSAFYWPFPFADGDPSNFVHDSTARGQEDSFRIDDAHTMDYRAWNFTQENNFCRVDIDRGNHRIVVRPYDSDGAPVKRGGWFGKSATEVVSELQLSPW